MDRLVRLGTDVVNGWLNAEAFTPHSLTTLTLLSFPAVYCSLAFVM